MTYCFSFFRIPPFNGLYTPFISPVCGGQKPQEREDVTALRCSEPLRYKVGGASKPSPCFAGWDRMGLRDDCRDQRLRPFPKSSECEPKRTNSIALLFLSNQIKTLIIFLELRGLSNFFHKLYSSIDAMKLSKLSTRTTPAS